jgi:hypothetical protein
VAAILSAWRQVAERVTDARLLTAPMAAQVGDHLLGRLGWETPGGKQYTMPAMTVRLFTAVQWQSASAAVSAKHTAFVQAVHATVGPGVTVAGVRLPLHGAPWRVGVAVVSAGATTFQDPALGPPQYESGCSLSCSLW